MAITLLQSANALGYETAHDKVTATAIFARICLRGCDAQLATWALEAIRGAEVDAREADAHASYKDLLTALQTIAQLSPTS